MAHNRGKNLVGLRFGKLTVLERAGSEKFVGLSRATWRCLCDCGNIVIANTRLLTSGHKKSCGCIPRVAIHPHKSHGRTGSRLYKTWCSMKTRCYNKNSSEYHRYGGRGIVMCEEWKDNPEAFIKWAESHGYRDNLTIDRIDNDKGYCPENCQFLTLVENNRRKPNITWIEIDGVRDTAFGWGRVVGISGNSLRQLYLKRGEEAVIQKIKEHKDKRNA